MYWNKELFDAALANISFWADNTWRSDTSDPFIQANQELWKRVCDLRRSESIDFRRSVLDTIPNSHLAEYGTFWYNEMRETAYEPNRKNSSIIEESDRNELTTSYLNKEFCENDLFESQEVEQLFRMLIDTQFNNEEIEILCHSFLKDLDLKEIKPNTFTLTRKSSKTLNKSSDNDNVDSDLFRDTNDKLILLKLREEKDENDEEVRKLEQRIYSEEIRALWDTKHDNELNGSGTEFHSKPDVREMDEPLLVPNFEMVPIVQPWLNIGYPLRHSDFCELASLSCEMEALCAAAQRNSQREKLFVTPLAAQNPLVPKEVADKSVSQPARRLYSAVLQNQPASVATTMPMGVVGASGAQGTIATIAATAMITDELDELEREAIEQYRPSNESLGMNSEDSIISAKFQELERLALEQYNCASVPETSTGGLTSDENTGNVPCPPHESPCGGKMNPYAALLLANWMQSYRCRLLGCLGAGHRFR